MTNPAMPPAESARPAAASEAEHARSGLGGGVRFLRQFLRTPGTVGAIAPSSGALARRMVEGIDFNAAKAVVEFGPGTGVFTRELLRRLAPATRFFAVELNPELARRCREQMPGVEIVTASAADIQALCAQRGIGQLDAVVSGLPWASFPPQLQDSILEPMLAMLRPGGVFVTFAYGVGAWLPAARRFHAKCARLFASTGRSRYVWRNLPPAFVLRCVK